MGSNDPRTWEEVEQKYARRKMLEGPPSLDPRWTTPEYSTLSGGTEVTSRRYIPNADEEYFANREAEILDKKIATLRDIRQQMESNSQPVTGPGNPEYQGKTVYATNIPSTAEKWKSEGKIGQGGQDNFAFLTNTPEETAEAKTKGYGKWGKIIGPPEAAVTAKKPKTESPYPGQPPSDDQIGDFQKFNGLWGAHVQKNWGGQDPLKMNPIEAREAAIKPLKEQNAQFIYDYETYGPQQMGPQATQRYNLLQKQIKESGDQAEEKIKNFQAQAKEEKTSMGHFFDKWKTEQTQAAKLTELEKFELNDIRQEEKGLREDLKKYSIKGSENIYGTAKIETIDKLQELGKRKNELMKKETSQPLSPVTGGAAHPLSGKPAGRYKVNGRVTKWDGKKELQ